MLFLIYYFILKREGLNMLMENQSKAHMHVRPMICFLYYNWWGAVVSTVTFIYLQEQLYHIPDDERNSGSRMNGDLHRKGPSSDGGEYGRGPHQRGGHGTPQHGNSQYSSSGGMLLQTQDFIIICVKTSKYVCTSHKYGWALLPRTLGKTLIFITTISWTFAVHLK